MGRARLWRITKEPGFTNGTGQFVLRLCRISRVFGLFLQMGQSRLFLCSVCELVSIALISIGLKSIVKGANKFESFRTKKNYQVTV